MGLTHVKIGDEVGSYLTPNLSTGKWWCLNLFSQMLVVQLHLSDSKPVDNIICLLGCEAWAEVETSRDHNFSCHEVTIIYFSFQVSHEKHINIKLEGYLRINGCQYCKYSGSWTIHKYPHTTFDSPKTWLLIVYYWPERSLTERNSWHILCICIIYCIFRIN